jgi:hypothetical protein
MLTLLLLLLQGVHPGCAQQQRALPAVQGRPQPPRAARARQKQPVNTRWGTPRADGLVPSQACVLA